MQKYEELKLEVVRFKSADVVTASGTRPPQTYFDATGDSQDQYGT